MSFDLSPEYLELQATVRKLAQEKIKPRARPIDTDATYPQDVFEVFRDAGLLGLVVPEEYGGGGGEDFAPSDQRDDEPQRPRTARVHLFVERRPPSRRLLAIAQR